MINSSNLIIAGIIVIFIGFILVILGTAHQGTNKSSDVKTGGVILIGPIPIIFGSDKGTIVAAVILAVIMMIIAYFLLYRGLKIF